MLSKMLFNHLRFRLVIPMSCFTFIYNAYYYTSLFISTSWTLFLSKLQTSRLLWRLRTTPSRAPLQPLVRHPGHLQSALGCPRCGRARGVLHFLQGGLLLGRPWLREKDRLFDNVTSNIGHRNCSRTCYCRSDCLDYFDCFVVNSSLRNVLCGQSAAKPRRRAGRLTDCACDQAMNHQNGSVINWILLIWNERYWCFTTTV